MNPVEAAELAWNRHLSNPKVSEAVVKITGGSSELLIAFRALWELNWIRKEWDETNNRTGVLSGAIQCEETAP